MDEEKTFLFYIGTAISIVLLVFLLAGCSTPKNSVETYKIQLGKKCSKDGNIYSYAWLHSVYGPQQVKKEYCNG